MAEYVTHEQLEARIKEAKTLRDEVCNMRHRQTDESIKVLFSKVDGLGAKLDTIALRVGILIVSTLMALVGTLAVQLILRGIS